MTFVDRAVRVFDGICLALGASTFKAAEDVSSSGPQDRFLAAAKALGATAQVLEIGTKRSRDETATHSHYAFVNVPRQNYTMVDVQHGADVDVVADLHHLPDEWSARFDAVIASAVFEHLERPWIAAKEIARVLAPGGFCYIATHQTFPLHAYPSDFFRFSKEALSLLFADAGLRVVEVAYQHRSQIVMPQIVLRGLFHRRWNQAYPSYVLVHLVAEKAR